MSEEDHLQHLQQQTVIFDIIFLFDHPRLVTLAAPPVLGVTQPRPSDRPRSHHQTLIQPSSPAQPPLPAALQMECFALNINYKAYNLIRCWVSVVVNLGSRHNTLLGQFVMRTPGRPDRNTNTPANSNQVTTCPL